MIGNLFKTALYLASLSLFFGTAFAEGESPWQEGDFAKARLVANYKTVPGVGEGDLLLGFQVQLQPGWKTYWRTPGSAGLPPQFSWEGSENVAKAEVLYPVPERFEIFNLHTYGYHDEVVYPILVTPANSGEAVLIKLAVNYLVCEDLCVPVSNTFEINLPVLDEEATPSIHAGIINRFLAQVPGKVEWEQAKVQILRQRVSGTPGAENIVLHMKAKGLMTGADLIIEDMEGFKFGVPRKRLLADANEAEFIIPVFALNEGTSLLGKEVVIVVADGWNNFEELILKLNE